MANLPISGLPAGTTIAAANEFPLVQGGTTNRSNAQAMKDFVAETSIAFKGAVQVPVGSSTAPSLRVGDLATGGTGFSNPDGRLFSMVGASVVSAWTSNGQSSFGDPLNRPSAVGGDFNFYRASNARIAIGGDTGSVSFQAFSAQAGATGPNILGAKANGASLANPSSVSSGGILLDIVGQGYGDDGYKNGARIRFISIETFASTAAASRIQLFASASGGTTLTEMARWDMGTGFSMYGANKVINQERAIMARAYTVAGISATQATNTGAGGMIYVTNAAAGARPYWSDGANFRDAAGVTVA